MNISSINELPDIDRKVKALLNKLTMRNFRSIADQITALANESEKETNGRTLRRVIQLVFEQAIVDASSAERYARLFHWIMERVSSQIRDDGLLNDEGKTIAGGDLFRIYILDLCKERLERRWVTKRYKGGVEERQGNDSNEAVVKVIGQLFKLQILPARIVHDCVDKLISNLEIPDEEEIKSLCALLTTIGAILDIPEARSDMDRYFSRMAELTKNSNISPRVCFMVQDVLELRERKWVARHGAPVPTTTTKLQAKSANEVVDTDDSGSASRTHTFTRSSARPPSKLKVQKAGHMALGSLTEE